MELHLLTTSHCVPEHRAEGLGPSCRNSTQQVRRKLQELHAESRLSFSWVRAPPVTQGLLIAIRTLVQNSHQAEQRLAASQARGVGWAPPKAALDLTVL